MTRLLGRSVYLDTNVFIYSVEQVAPYAEALRPLFRDVARGGTRATTSEITLAETLVQPFRTLDARLQVAFEDALSVPGLSVVPVSRTVLLHAARLRAALRLKLPDAIHAATAQLAGCDVLLTNDTGIAAVPGVEVLRLSEVVHS
jgi:predicted nucleic acid-binding protein